METDVAIDEGYILSVLELIPGYRVPYSDIVFLAAELSWFLVPFACIACRGTGVCVWYIVEKSIVVVEEEQKQDQSRSRNIKQVQNGDPPVYL